MTVDTGEQLERVALLNAQLERELALVLLGPFAMQRSRLLKVLCTTASLLMCWNALTLARAFIR